VSVPLSDASVGALDMRPPTLAAQDVEILKVSTGAAPS
jgi:hypothetical protein